MKIHSVLDRSELPSDTVQLARFLIGKLLVRATPAGVLSGRIVETEAYPIGDAASHAFIGMTKRNRALFASRGHAYVYFVYGSAYLLDISSEDAGIGAGVLVRALEPLSGVATMQQNRGVQDLRKLASGPGKLTTALSIDRQFDGIDLCKPGPLWLAHDEDTPRTIGVSPRIGLSREADRLLRFFERSSPFVSGSAKLKRDASIHPGA